MALYSTLYGRFAELQSDPSAGPRLVYPSGLPSILVGDKISDCAVGVPQVKVEKGVLLYGPFVMYDDAFGRYAATRLMLASTCLLGAKVSFMWRHREGLAEWTGAKQDKLRAGYAANMIFDSLARQKIQSVQGRGFYRETIAPADLLSAMLLPESRAGLPAFFQATLARVALGVPSVHLPSPIGEMAGEFVSLLNSLHDSPKKEWSQLQDLADAIYAVVLRFPGRWHTVYLPYANAIQAKGADHIEIFGRGPVDRRAFERSMQETGPGPPDLSAGDDLFFEIGREKQRGEKILSRIERASRLLNFGSFGFPACDYARYSRLYGELAPQIRRMIENARLVRNVLDENAFEQSGNVDLQVAIQAVAGETMRNDMFFRDEELLKNESWAILVDSSLSLGGIGDQLRSTALCVAETAKEVIGQNSWGMFAFSDDFNCIKDFSEPYDTISRSRIGGLVPNGLSHIPDALRLARGMLLEHSSERNYIILVSDGMPSGYQGIEKEFKAAVKELCAHGVALAAIGIGVSRIRQAVPNAKLVGEPADMAKAFSELYFALSS
jgi:hypothetical protein